MDVAAASAGLNDLPGEEHLRMWDCLALLFTMIFFAIALWYVRGCERLR